MTIRIHPRVPENAPGDFYVEAGLCWHCTLAPGEAQPLMHIPQNSNESCYFKRQPGFPEEIDAAIQAICVSEMCAIRYAGTDQAILRRLWEKRQANQCDHAPAHPPSPPVEQRQPWWTTLEGAHPNDPPPEAMRQWIDEIGDRPRLPAP